MINYLIIRLQDMVGKLRKKPAKSLLAFIWMVLFSFWVKKGIIEGFSLQDWKDLIEIFCSIIVLVL